MNVSLLVHFCYKTFFCMGLYIVNRRFVLKKYREKNYGTGDNACNIYNYAGI